MAVELEIKLTLHPRQIPKAVKWLLEQPEASPGARRQLINRYYDTPDTELNRQRIALRLRHAGGRILQTLKTQGEFVNGAHKRNEWEWEVAGPHLQLELLADTPLADNANLALLVPVFETNFERQVIMLEDDSAIIEVAVDSGEIIAGNKRRDLCEIEFELKSGNADRLLIWAQKLAQQCPLFLNLVSKAEQGYFLANDAGSVRGPEHAEKSENTGSDSAKLTTFLHQLSQSWLRQQPVDTASLDFDSLKNLAVRCGMAQDWAQLEAPLQDREQISDLLQQPLLGRVQLALLRHLAADPNL